MPDDIKTRLLDVAQRLIQTRGFHGFSYRDLAAEVGITTASIHYHFPTKADLGVALVRRYREMIVGAVVEAAAGAPTLPGQLERLTTRLFGGALKDDRGARVCLCAALAGEHGGLPAAVQTELRELIESSETGIADLLRAGQSRGELPAGADPLMLARLWYSTLQGALIVARASRPQTLAEVSTALLRLTFARS